MCPMLDRIDVQMEVLPVEYRQLSSTHTEESSSDVRARVTAARQVQVERLGSVASCNAYIPDSLLREICGMESAAEKLLHSAFDRLHMSARGYSRILKVARTIADLERSGQIAASHIAQAIQMRSLDRKYWGSK